MEFNMNFDDLVVLEKPEVHNKLSELTLKELHIWAEQNDLPIRKSSSRVKALEDLTHMINAVSIYRRISKGNRSGANGTENNIVQK